MTNHWTVFSRRKKVIFFKDHSRFRELTEWGGGKPKIPFRKSLKQVVKKIAVARAKVVARHVISSYNIQ